MSEPLKKEDHPSGLCPEDRKLWDYYADKLFFLYKKIGHGVTKRMFIGGTDESKQCVILFFNGTAEDLFEIREFLILKDMRNND